MAIFYSSSHHDKEKKASNSNPIYFRCLGD
jgi:hypothetical protein